MGEILHGFGAPDTMPLIRTSEWVPIRAPLKTRLPARQRVDRLPDPMTGRREHHRSTKPSRGEIRLPHPVDGIKWIASFPANVAGRWLRPPRYSSQRLRHRLPLCPAGVRRHQRPRTAASAALAAAALGTASPNSVSVVGAGVVARAICHYLTIASIPLPRHDRSRRRRCLRRSAGRTPHPGIRRPLPHWDPAPDPRLQARGAGHHGAPPIYRLIAGTLADVLLGRCVPDSGRAVVFSPFGLGVPWATACTSGRGGRPTAARPRILWRDQPLVKHPPTERDFP